MVYKIPCYETRWSWTCPRTTVIAEPIGKHRVKEFGVSATVDLATMEIVNGPGTTALLQALLQLNAKAEVGDVGNGVRVVFTCRIPATNETRKARVMMIRLQSQPGAAPERLYFAGTCWGSDVEGWYDYSTHKGQLRQF